MSEVRTLLRTAEVGLVFARDAVPMRQSTEILDSRTTTMEASWLRKVKMMKATSVAYPVGGRVGHRSAGPVIFVWQPL